MQTAETPRLESAATPTDAPAAIKESFYIRTPTKDAIRSATPTDTSSIDSRSCTPTDDLYASDEPTELAVALFDETPSAAPSPTLKPKANAPSDNELRSLSNMFSLELFV